MDETQALGGDDWNIDDADEEGEDDGEVDAPALLLLPLRQGFPCAVVSFVRRTASTSGKLASPRQPPYFLLLVFLVTRTNHRSRVSGVNFCLVISSL